MKMKHLTNPNKKRIMHNDSRLSFLAFRKQFQRVKKIVTSGSFTISSLSHYLPHKGRKGKIMNMVKSLFGGNSSSARFARAIFIGSLVILGLSACGGGGGGGTTPAPTVTVVCPDGTSQTAVSASVANAACPAPTLVSLAPANGATSVTPDSIAASGIMVATSSALTIPNVADISLKAGTTDVPGVITLVGTKGLTFTPATKLRFSQAYAFAASLRDGLGKALAIQSTFTTSAIQCVLPQQPASDGQSCVDPVVVTPTCTAPAMLNSANTCISPPAVTGYTWNTANKVWVADIGVLGTGLNTLPAECVNFGDACWKASSANGTIKYFATNMVISGRNQIMAGYIIGGTGVGSGNFFIMPFYADADADTPVSNKAINATFEPTTMVTAKGSQDGVKFTIPGNLCGEIFHNGTGVTDRAVQCPI
jgi:hypothetical protein